MSTNIAEPSEGRQARPSFLVEHCRRFLGTLSSESEVREARIIGPRGVEASAYFDDPQKLLEAVSSWDGTANLYVTLNPVDPAHLDGSLNRVVRKPKKTTTDTDVLRRAWLFIDVDSVRPSGSSATEVELAEARKVLDRLTESLRAEGWPEPVTCLSGNGHYALYPIQLPNDQESKQLIERVLRSLATRFDTTGAHIDTNVANASRLIGLVGSLKMKGEPSEERPHRRSRILSLPDMLVPVPFDLLEKMAARRPPQRSGPGAESIPLRDLLDDARVDYRGQPEDAQGIIWYQIRICPFHGADHPYECGVGQGTDGHFAGKCFHDPGKGWQEWKAALGIQTGRTPSRAGDAADEPSPGRQFQRSDSGNAELFADLYGGRVRYDHRRSKWFIWSGHHWDEDGDGEVDRLGLETVRTRYHEAERLEDLGHRQGEAKFAIQSENRSRLEALLSQARSLRPIASSGASWDQDQLLLGVGNGVIDLREGGLRPGRPEDQIRLFTPVSFERDATCPRWRQFLSEVFDADAELIDFVSLAVGYTLTGLTNEQCLFLLHGNGANGKSVFLNVLSHLLGSYAYNAPFSTFELRGRNEISNDVAALAARRLVTASETNAGTRLNEARIKALTGGDVMTARFLYGENFSFRPEAKFWLAVNHLPLVDDVSVGFWRRVRLLPFLRTFTADADRHLEDTLLAELPGILAWAVRGSVAWQQSGLTSPDRVQAATEDYRRKSDPFAEFVAECLTDVEAGLLPAGLAYDAYKDWAKNEGWAERDLMSGKTFGTRMSERFDWTRKRGGKLYLNLKLVLPETGGEE